MTNATLQVRGLGKTKLNALTRKAGKLGMTPESYVKQLVEDDLAVSEEARTKTFAQIMDPGFPVDEEEVDRLVEQAKKHHHENVKRRKH